MKTLLAKTLWGFVRKAIEAQTPGAIELAADWVATRLQVDRERVKDMLELLASLGDKALDAVEAIIFAQVAVSFGRYGCEQPDCPHELAPFVGILDALAGDAVLDVTEEEFTEAAL